MKAVKLRPVFKQIIWGGKRLKSEFGFDSDLPKIAEAWMLSCREDGMCVTECSDKALSTFLSSEVLGTNYCDGTDFPLLIKLIDAESDLSVQVHPNDEYAKEHENSRGKTEAWYIIDCDEGAELIYGFKDKISSEEFRAALENNTILDVVSRVKVHKGDFFFIPSGTLHAIGGGILLAEVQQNCNTTYRVYDYNRLDNGKLRPLHIDKAVDVTVTAPAVSEYSPITRKIADTEITELCNCEYFTMSVIKLNGSYIHKISSSSFVSAVVLDGVGKLKYSGDTLSFNKGESIFIPAGDCEAVFTGKAEILISTI